MTFMGINTHHKVVRRLLFSGTLAVGSIALFETSSMALAHSFPAMIGLLIAPGYILSGILRVPTGIPFTVLSAAFQFLYFYVVIAIIGDVLNGSKTDNDKQN